jgi:lipopolysaccharide assembly outer membrane protein LptD (OstA)
MSRLRASLAFVVCLLVVPRIVYGQAEEGWQITPYPGEGWVQWDQTTGILWATNGVKVTYGHAVLIGDRCTVNQNTGEAVADGHVRVQKDEQLWASEHMLYNFKTGRFEAGEFRTGRPPFFAFGQGLRADSTNQVFATNAVTTTDDVSNPAIVVRAKYIKVIPGQRIEARNAVLYIDGVPVFFFPYYSRQLGSDANNFNFLPGYRSSFGPYLLTSYDWHLDPELDAVLHTDYRWRRGPGAGPDFNYHFGQWGSGSIKYYYTHDQDPTASVSGATNIPPNRQRIYASYQANPVTNLYITGLGRYQTDTNVLRDFLESEYRENPQPYSFLEADRFWQNFSLDTYVQPRPNGFLETVERLPEVRLTGFPQEIGQSPLYYESQSSFGYYRRVFGPTNETLLNGGIEGFNRDFEGARGDSFHQITLPYTFFGWLNVTPRVGGRVTYYSDTIDRTTTSPGSFNNGEDVYRGVFNTGAEVSFKASRSWPDISSDFFQADGLRHIIQPSANYVFVPSPNYHPSQLPQWDYEFPSLRLLPIDFPEYNAIDAIDSRNVVRLGLLNKLQTKRLGETANLVNWDLYTDFRLEHEPDLVDQGGGTNQNRFSDVFSDLTFKPRSWLTVESLTRYDPEAGYWRMAYHSITLQPSDVWSWTLGSFLIRNEPLSPPYGLGQGNNLFTSSFFYRLNENWGFRALHRFEAQNGQLEEQAYTIYRDMRSWTAGLTFRVVNNPTAGPQDVTVAFTFSIKAFPHYGLGSDTGKPYSLLGG